MLALQDVRDREDVGGRLNCRWSPRAVGNSCPFLIHTALEVTPYSVHISVIFDINRSFAAASVTRITVAHSILKTREATATRQIFLDCPQFRLL